MKKRSIVKNLVIFSSLVTLLLLVNSSSLKKKKANSFKIEKGRIEYSDGVIYIGDQEYLDTIKDLDPYDVLVLDQRQNKDPNLKIYDSYKIRNPEIREEIVDGLLLYEEEFDTNWERSKVSATREWTVHNYCYDNGYEIERTKDVDLNNGDEITYRIRKKLLN